MEALEAPIMEHELEVLRRAVRRAGDRALQLAASGFQIHLKRDRSPVTTADLEIDHLLHDDLLEAFPEDGWLSEERADTLQRLERKRVWIVDPIDGTKYFMNGIPQYAISVALVEAHRPVLAMIYNPATGELFWAVRGAGAWLNEKPIRVKEAQPGRPVILVSPPAFQRGRFTPLEALAECRPMGSIAYTLALVAAGQADGALNVDHLNEWDIVAGVLLVEEAGGSATDNRGRPLVFNQPGTAIQGILAGGFGLMDQLKMFVKTLSA
jgi:myo-inositol-1(or 4)-monophosphatase